MINKIPEIILTYFEFFFIKLNTVFNLLIIIAEIINGIPKPKEYKVINNIPFIISCSPYNKH